MFLLSIVILIVCSVRGITTKDNPSESISSLNDELVPCEFTCNTIVTSLS